MYAYYIYIYILCVYIYIYGERDISVYKNDRLFRKPPLLGPPLSCAKVGWSLEVLNARLVFVCSKSRPWNLKYENACKAVCCTEILPAYGLLDQDLIFRERHPPKYRQLPGQLVFSQRPVLSVNTLSKRGRGGVQYLAARRETLVHLWQSAKCKVSLSLSLSFSLSLSLFPASFTNPLSSLPLSLILCQFSASGPGTRSSSTLLYADV